MVAEDDLRWRARSFLEALGARHADYDVLFASKAFPCTAVYRLLAEEGLACDVASGGELFLALRGGFDPARIYFHGNAKSVVELREAVEAGVGHIVVDSLHELERLERVVAEARAPAGGADPGHAGGGGRHPPRDLDRSDRLEVRLRARGGARRRSSGWRPRPTWTWSGCTSTSARSCSSSSRSARRCGRSRRWATSRSTTSAAGWGWPTPRPTSPPAIADYVDADRVGGAHECSGADKRLLLEPGRALVANSAVTLYTVETVKRNVSTWVAVDGGMSDNLRPMLYGSRYEALIVDRPLAPAEERCHVAGKHCESGRRDRARDVAGRSRARRRDRHAGDRRLRLLAGQQLQRRARARR